jgi:C1A family cysteine protease
LSEQIVLSCSGAGSCDGGSPGAASNFLKNSGTNLETCYPYKAQNANCSSACANWQNSTYRIDNWNYGSRGSPPDASAIRNAIYTSGPVVAVFDVYTDFFSYHSGVYSYVSGEYEGGHAILIVGWDDAESAFVVKNSWGTGWGESGFFKIAYSELTGTTKFAGYSYAYGTVSGPLPPPPPTGLNIAGFVN